MITPIAITAPQVSASANIVAAIGVLFAIWQIWQQSLRWQHERNVDVLKVWVQVVGDLDEAQIRIGRLLSPAQADLLADHLPISLEDQQVLEVLELLPQGSPEHLCCKERRIISRRVVVEIRGVFVNYFNAIELALSGWTRKVSDKKFLEEQFSDLVDDKTGRFVFQNLFEAFGGKHCYPNIDKFIGHRRKNLRSEFP